MQLPCTTTDSYDAQGNLDEQQTPEGTILVFGRLCFGYRTSLSVAGPKSVRNSAAAMAKSSTGVLSPRFFAKQK
jgi:hypothetical protein